jgi:glyoxylase-like metal-dependent hydrolase (beta-lactamase superfamily II)
MRLKILIIAASASLLASAVVSAPADPPSPSRKLHDGLWLVEGGIRGDRQPDGNSVVLAGKTGLIVFDTGRHDWHLRGIEAVFRETRRPPVAIFNSHWHLDHVIGDIELRRQYPQVKVYASSAIDRALTGFLPNSAADGRRMLASGKLNAGETEDINLAVMAVENGDKLRPDVVVSDSRTMVIDGRRLDVHLARDAATDGDVWLYDPATRTAIVGDLITLPSPFLDTACSEGWRRGLAEVAKVPFRQVIPGHGPPMDRAGFERYRAAFGALIDCSKTPVKGEACAAAWTLDVAPFLATQQDRELATGMTVYYVDEVMRKNGGDSRSCRLNGAVKAG